MIRKEQDGIAWLEFELFAEHPEIAHAVFLRQGGVSTGPYSSLNVGRFGKEIPDNVEENIKRILGILPLEKLVCVHEVHDTHIAHVQDPEMPLPPADGLATGQPNVGLMITHADCQAVIFYDPIHRAIANVHAGWRGQTKQIFQKTIAQMGKWFESRPCDLLVAISPSLGPQNSEFINYKTELPEDWWCFQIKPTYFDLWAISEYQLTQCGILPHHLQIARIDTYANPADFFSYRRSRAAGLIEQITGCHGTVAGFKSTL